uniref:Head morphogenesis protein n=1 Tax=Pseudomonas phage Pavpe01 TaxID=3138545 RepID=A0AAU6W080_9VIRU
MPSPLLNRNAPDSRRLFDVVTRQQVYVEGVKLDQANQFREVIRELSDEFRNMLGRLNYSTLDGMTKAELNSFIVVLRKSQQRIYNKYTQQLLDQLYAFMTVDKRVTLRMYGALVSDEDEVSLSEAEDLVQQSKDESLFVPLFGWAGLAATGKGDSALWSTISNNPIPANGLLLGAFIAGFSKSAQASVENLIRMGYANHWTVNETLNAIIGPQGQMSKVFNQNTAVSATIIQHIAQSVGAAVSSAFAGRYRWDSVMDNATSDICRGRNRRIYEYGRGPLPPAHIRCRSRITPIFGNGGGGSDGDNETFYTWTRRQPETFVRDVFNQKAADSIINGSSRAKDFTEYRAEKPLSVQQYADKLSEILKR